MLLLYIMCNHLLLSLKLSIDIILYWNSVIHVDFKSGSIDVELKIYDYNFIALAVALVKVTKGIHSHTVCDGMGISTYPDPSSPKQDKLVHQPIQCNMKNHGKHLSKHSSRLRRVFIVKALVSTT